MTVNQNLINLYIDEILGDAETLELIEYLDSGVKAQEDTIELDDSNLAELAQKYNVEPKESTFSKSNIYNGKSSLFRCTGRTCVKVWRIDMSKAKPPSVCPDCGAMVRLEKA